MVPLFFFLLSLQRIWFRSSMDRMKDSGSFDWGSSPHGITEQNEGVQKVFGTLDLFVSLLETEIKYPILQGGILPFWTPSFVFCCNFQNFVRHTLNFDAFFYIW